MRTEPPKHELAQDPRDRMARPDSTTLQHRNRAEPASRCQVDEEVFSYYQRLDRVRHLVLARYHLRITLEDAAAVARMESCAFSTFFHRKTGVRFRNWLGAVRVAKAQELFRTSNISVKQTAFEVGLANVRTFERVFLRVTGSTPIAYKNSVRPS